MSHLSGIKRLDYYSVIQITDHIWVNQANNLPLTKWEIDNFVNLTLAGDYWAYFQGATLEMA